ncbi:MAG: hypothetical protein ACI4U5_02615 [Bacilli bacterium]
MDKVLKAIGGFFKRIWEWIKNTAWVQPVLIVSLIFAVIFSINPIVNGIKSALNSNNKEGAFYKAHSKTFNEKNFNAVTQEDCLVIFVDLENASSKEAAYTLEKYVKNFYTQTENAKIYVFNFGCDDDDSSEKERIATLIDDNIHDTFADLYNYYLPTDKFTYNIKYSAWDSNGENEYLNGTTTSSLNSPTFVRYENGNAVDIRFDISSYTDNNDKSINEITILTDLWNGTNKN